MTEAEIVFTQILGCSRQQLYAQRTLRLGARESHVAAGVLRRRIAGQPLDYILGETEFMGLVFKVSPDVLVPRQETEILVETTIRLVSGYQDSDVSILDVGTGSGCIAISLGKFLPRARITAIDISETALAVARTNAHLHGVKINFIKSDLFQDIEVRRGSYDYIVSNPPYIPTGDIASLQREVRCEPAIALDAGPDGLDFFRSIVSKGQENLKTGGFLLMEMGYNQTQTVKNLIQKSGKFEIIDIVKDYGGIERVMVCRRHG